MRLIPAHAGKTWAFRFPRLWTGAHPRSRGENIQASSPSRVHAGSSPLTRGKRFPALVVGVSWGLIPAHAGKTRRWARPRRWSRAHPRSRGENRFSVSAGSTLAGSSPLTRGKPRKRGPCERQEGLIPAHAGKTRPWRPVTRPTRAHPRSRGENLEIANPRGEAEGSSPLTRGKPDPAHHHPARAGLIPAHAGKTRPRGLSLLHCWAHPRSRGENARRRVELLSVMGSSPLTRGKLGLAAHAQVPPGLIPAHAGKTRTRHTLSM